MSIERKFKRRCIICGKYKDKSELLRLTKESGSSDLKLNINSEFQGYSFYICKDRDCLKKSLKNKVLTKYTKLNYPEKLREIIKQMLNS